MSRCQVFGCKSQASFMSEKGLHYCTTHRVAMGTRLRFKKIHFQEEINEPLTLQAFIKGED